MGFKEYERGQDLNFHMCFEESDKSFSEIPIALSKKQMPNLFKYMLL